MPYYKGFNVDPYFFILKMKNIYIKYTKYNYWANCRLADTLKKLPPELIDKELKSSFKTIKLTVLHIYDAETIWLERLNDQPAVSWPSAKFTGSNFDALELLQNSSEQLIDKIEGLAPELFDTQISFNDMKGNPHKAYVNDIIQHAVNHSTFHRGQIVTMLRECGVTEISSTDYITFTRERLK